MESPRPLKVKVSLSLDEEVVKKLRILAEEDDRQLSIMRSIRSAVRSLFSSTRTRAEMDRKSFSLSFFTFDKVFPPFTSN